MRATRLDLPDEPLAQRHRGGAQIGHIDPVPGLQRLLQHRQLQDRRGADAQTFGGHGRTIGQFHVERAGMAEPPGQRRLQALDDVRPGIDEGRRAGAAIEVLISAADGEFRVAGGDVHRHRARAMGEIPDHHRARLMRLPRDRVHVMPPPAAEIDLGQQDGGDILADRAGHVLGGHQPQLVILADRVDQALRHVEIGREIAGIGQHHLARGPHLKRRRQRLVDLDRQGVTGGHGAFRRADQLPDPVAHDARQVHPARRVPGLDQVRAPFVAHHAGHTLGGPFRQRPERIPVEIENPLGQVEQLFSRQGHGWAFLFGPV